jgi:hypothetical protein
MVMYLHATLELSYAGLPKFLAMAPTLRRILEQEGWVLVNALVQVTGRLNTVIHIWRLRDANHYSEVVAKLRAHPDFPEIHRVLCEAVDEERLLFATAADYAPPTK